MFSSFNPLSSTNGRPSTPVPAFILTDTSTSSTSLDKSDAGATALTKSLDMKLKNLRNTLGDTHPDVAQTIISLGDACMKNEDYDEALRYYTEALNTKKDALDKNHPSIADTLYSIGTASKELSMLKESKSNFQAALDMYRHALKDKSWLLDGEAEKKEELMTKIDYYLQHSIASTQSTMGSVEFQQDKYDSAMKYFNHALQDAKRATVLAVNIDRKESTTTTSKNKGEKEKSTLKDSRVFVTEMFNNIASVCAEQGDKGAAIQNYNSALALQIQELGEDDPSVACTLHNIGTMHCRSGEYQLSLKSYKQVLKMRRYLFNSEDPCVAETLLNISSVHEKAGEFDKGESALNAALRICTKQFGSKSIQVAVVKQRLGSLFARENVCNNNDDDEDSDSDDAYALRANLDEKALDYFSKALKIYKHDCKLDESHACVKSVRSSMEYVKTRSSNGRATIPSLYTSATELVGLLLNDGCSTLCLPEYPSNDAGPLMSYCESVGTTSVR